MTGTEATFVYKKNFHDWTPSHKYYKFIHYV